VLKMLHVRKSILIKTMFFLVASACLLNLNGMMSMLTGMPSLVTPLVVLVSLIGLFLCKFRRRSFGDSYIAVIVLYVIFSVVFSVFSVFRENDMRYAITYIASAVVILFVYRYLSAVDIDRYMVPLVNISFLAVCSVFFSTALNSIYLNPPSFVDRFSGFFGNANEVGMLAVAVTIFSLRCYSLYRRLVYILFAVVCSVAVLLTFSKTAMLSLLLVAIYLLIFFRAFLVLFILVLSVLFVMVFNDIAIGLFSALSNAQAARLQQFLQFLSADISNETTTGRIELYGIGISRIADNLALWGDGIGTFHRMEGGVFSKAALDGEDGWLGVHNTYLMILGEGGIIPFALFVSVNILLIFRLIKIKDHFFILYFMVLQFDYFVSHNALQLRFHDLLLGVSLAYASKSAKMPSRNQII
jgi:O-antigen ligase